MAKKPQLSPYDRLDPVTRGQVDLSVLDVVKALEQRGYNVSYRKNYAEIRDAFCLYVIKCNPKIEEEMNNRDSSTFQHKRQ